MFKNHRTKILFWPREEILEVHDEPSLQQIVALESFDIRGYTNDIYYGIITDYNGVEYDFEWNKKEQRLCRLVGSQVNGLIWGLAYNLLYPYFNPVEDIVETVEIVEEGPTIVDVLQTVREGFNHISSKIEESSRKEPVVITQTIETPKMPALETSYEIAEEIEEDNNSSLDDDDISQHALQFLSQSKNIGNLEVDYLSL